MPPYEDSSKCSSCSCSSDKIRTVFESNKNFTDKKYRGSNKNGSAPNLSELACRFECLIARVKQLELLHLIEPIESAANKLRLLEEYTEKIACNCDYGDSSRSKGLPKNEPAKHPKRPCSGKSTKSPQPQPKKNKSTTSESSSDSCACRDTSSGVKTCRCGSEPMVPKPKSSMPQDQPCKNEVEPPNSACKDPSEPWRPYLLDHHFRSKCDPCSCAVDPATGKRAKSQGCKEAAKARRRNYQKPVEDTEPCPEQNDIQSYVNGNNKQNDMRPFDVKILNNDIPNGEIVSELVVSGEFSLGGIGAQLTFSTLKIKEENEESNGLRANERNQAILCNMSSTDDESLCSCDTNCCTPFFRRAANGDSAATNDVQRRFADNPTLDSCGCGCPDDDDDDEACPCGCGDLMGRPRKRDADYRCPCRCVGCGKELTDELERGRRMSGAGDKRGPRDESRKQRRSGTGKSLQTDEPRYAGEKRRSLNKSIAVTADF